LVDAVNLDADLETFLLRKNSIDVQPLVIINNNNNNSNSNNNNKHAHLLPSCHRNRRYLESLGCWACPGNWQTGHINHWQTQRIRLSVSAVVNSPPKGKCGRLPQHLWLRL